MREWEKNRLNLDWNIQELLGDTIRYAHCLLHRSVVAYIRDNIYLYIISAYIYDLWLHRPVTYGCRHLVAYTDTQIACDLFVFVLFISHSIPLLFPLHFNVHLSVQGGTGTDV